MQKGGIIRTGKYISKYYIRDLGVLWMLGSYSPNAFPLIGGTIASRLT